VLYLKAVQGNIRALFVDSQVRWFLSIIAISITIFVIYLINNTDMQVPEALRRSAFNVVSIITGTGYSSGDYGVWGGFAVALFFFLMVVGGCAGSTACGIKIFRFQVLSAVMATQLKQLIHPNGVFRPRYNGKPIPVGVPTSVMSFFFLYALSFSFLTIALSFTGLDFLTAMSGAATSISNVGPGLGEMIGPSGTFAPLPDSAKWLLCVGMILGRLELFTLLVLFVPQFWRK
jgi:trk system potassium uptake protein TrkH